LKNIFLWVKNPENIFTIFTAVGLGAFVHTNLLKNRMFLRIDTRKTAESEEK